MDPTKNNRLLLNHNNREPQRTKQQNTQTQNPRKTKRKKATTPKHPQTEPEQMDTYDERPHKQTIDTDHPQRNQDAGTTTNKKSSTMATNTLRR